MSHVDCVIIVQEYDSKKQKNKNNLLSGNLKHSLKSECKLSIML